MAVTITDNRTVVDEADATTGWTSSSGTPTVFTTAPDPVESTACLGIQVSNATEEIYHTITTDNLTNSLVYVWMLPGGVLDTTANGGIQVILGDGTDRVGYHVGGSNGAGFRHDDGPVVWQCFVIDTSTLPANLTTFAGNAGNLTLTTITQIGGAFKTLAKSVGGVENCFNDILFYGNGGLTITGGGVGTEGRFIEIAERDRSTADHPGTGVASATGGAYGICRELGADLIGLQGPLTFGDSAGTSSVRFADSGQTVVFEDRGIGTDKYGITITGNATGTTSFVLGNKSGASTGADGCSLIVPTGVGGFFRAQSPNIDSCALYGCTLSGFTNGVTFSSNLLTAPKHEVFSSSFVGCGLITIGEVVFKNNNIASATDSAAALVSSTVNISDLTFTSAGSNTGIRIDSAGTYDFTNIFFNGYNDSTGSNLNPGSGSLNAAVWNNSGGAVTINVSGGSVPSVRNSTGSTTTVLATVTLTLTGMKDNTEVRIYNSVDNTPPYTAPTELAGIENAVTGTTDNRSFSFTATPATTIYIRTFNTNWIADDIVFTVPSTNAEIPIAQRRDRVYTNP